MPPPSPCRADSTTLLQPTVSPTNVQHQTPLFLPFQPGAPLDPPPLICGMRQIRRDDDSDFMPGDNELPPESVLAGPKDDNDDVLLRQRREETMRNAVLIGRDGERKDILFFPVYVKGCKKKKKDCKTAMLKMNKIRGVKVVTAQGK